MTTNPSVTDSINGNDFIVIRKNQDFDYRVLPYPYFIQQLKTDLGGSLLSNQYLSMSANTAIDLNSIPLDIWVNIQVASPGLTLTVNLPLPTYTTNGQELLLTNSSANTVNLTFNGFGAQIVGGSTTITSGSTIKFKYDKSLNTWYKV